MPINSWRSATTSSAPVIGRKNLTRAIAAARTALPFFDARFSAEKRARLLITLGEIYADYYRGRRADNLREALALFREAQEFFSPHVDPEIFGQLEREAKRLTALIPLFDVADALVAEGYAPDYSPEGPPEAISLYSVPEEAEEPAEPIDPFPRSFVGREAEIERFKSFVKRPVPPVSAKPGFLRKLQGLVSSSETSTPKAEPFFGFHGPSGVGKCWLLRRFQELAQDHKVPVYALELDFAELGSAIPDRAGLCAALVAAFDIPAPRIFFALCFLLQIETQGLREGFQGPKSEDEIRTFVDSHRAYFYEFNLGSLYGSTFAEGWLGFDRQRDALVRYLLTPEGISDREWMETHGTIDVRDSLFGRLSRDLAEHPTPARPVRAVVLVNAAGDACLPGAEEDELRQAFAWMSDLHRATREKSPILIVPFSEFPLPFPAPYASWPLAGLTRTEAEIYARNQGLAENLVPSALEVSAGIDGDPLHHPLTLAFATEMLIGNPTFRMDRILDPIGNRLEWLAARYDQTSRDHGWADCIPWLASTPKWDRSAFAKLHRTLSSGRSSCEEEWAAVKGLSYVRMAPNGWRSIHRRVVEYLTPQNQANKIGDFWTEYWRSRAKATNDLASRSYLAHRYLDDSYGGNEAWLIPLSRAKGEERYLDAADYLASAAFQLLMPQDGPGAAYLWGREAMALPKGNSTANLYRAISAFRYAYRLNDGDDRKRLVSIMGGLISAHDGLVNEGDPNWLRVISLTHEVLQFITPRNDPVVWADTQLFLGTAHDRLKGGVALENKHAAIKAYASALQVFTKEENPYRWAYIKQQIGSTWSEVIPADKGRYLPLTVEAFNQSLTVFRSDTYPEQFVVVSMKLAKILATHGDFELATKYADRALPVAEAEALPEHAAFLRNFIRDNRPR